MKGTGYGSGRELRSFVRQWGDPEISKGEKSVSPLSWMLGAQEPLRWAEEMLPLPEMPPEVQGEVPRPPSPFLASSNLLTVFNSLFLKGWDQRDASWLRSLGNPACKGSIILQSKAEQGRIKNKSKDTEVHNQPIWKDRCCLQRWSPLSEKPSLICAQRGEDDPLDPKSDVKEWGAHFSCARRKVTTSTTFKARTLDPISAMGIPSVTHYLFITIHW